MMTVEHLTAIIDHLSDEDQVRLLDLVLERLHTTGNGINEMHDGLCTHAVEIFENEPEARADEDYAEWRGDDLYPRGRLSMQVRAAHRTSRNTMLNAALHTAEKTIAATA